MRLRLIGLVLLALAPALGLVLASGLRHRAEIREEAKVSAVRLARIAAHEQRIGAEASARRRPVDAAGAGEWKWLAALVETADLSSEWLVVVFDETGTILARNQESERWIGHRDAVAPIVRAAREATSGTFEGKGLDGVARAWGYARLRPAATGEAVTIAVGAPQGVLYAAAEYELRRNLIGILLAGFVALVATWFFGERTLVRPVAALLSATARIRGGDLSARAGIADGTGDLSRLAESFDAMADSLQRERERAGEAQAEVAASEARFRSLVDTAADAVVAADEEQRIVLFNRGAEEAFGWKAEEVIGKPLDVLLPPRSVSSHRELVRGFGASGGEARRMGVGRLIHGRRKDGSEFPAEASISRLAVGGRTTYTAILRDVTERVRLEEQFRHAQKMESVGRLAGGVAHDFNNVLTAILGHTDLALKHVPDSGGVRDNLQEVRKATLRAGGLTRQLLAFARRQGSSPRIVRANELISNMEKMLRRFVPEDVQLETALDPGAGPVRVDPGQLEQVLVNLVVNAKDAMPDGGRLLLSTANASLDSAYVAGHPGVAAGAYVRISVEDSGVGMSEDAKQHLFEPFFTTKEVGKGTGLGLATCFGIVKGAGGHLAVYSESGGGTSVHVYLPAAAEAAETVRVEAPRDSPPGHETVLVVDDDDSVRAVAVAGLREAGYRVLEAGSGADAIERNAGVQKGVDLLLTDVVMPGMGGLELATLLRAGLPRLRVVFMSGYTERMEATRGALEHERLVHKPFALDALARAVRSALDA